MYGGGYGGGGGGGYGGQYASQPMMMDGRELRKDPYAITKDDFDDTKGMDDEKAERKLDTIKAGARIQEENPYLPEDRGCQDAVWVLFFLLTVGATLATGYMYCGSLAERAEQHKAESKQQEEFLEDTNPQAVMGAGAAGAAGAAICSLLFVMMAHRFPKCAVYSALFFSPCFMIVFGLALVASGIDLFPIFGGIMICLGLCSAFCTFFCWRQYIPFMIVLTECVAGVGEDHPSMIFIALFAGVLGLAWTVACFVAFIATYLEYEDDLNDQDENVKRFLYGFCVFVYFWGGQVIDNVCHVTYCGVFGRWYFRGGDNEPVVADSLKVALGTSFGSICMGSFMIAVIRALEAVARQMRQQAQEEGNAVMCVLLCLLECVISCIGDMLEYFNSWAYVQCAVRGTNFCDSAKITMAMIKLTNLQYIMSDLLLDSLVSMGAMMCALAGTIAGIVAAYLLSAGSTPTLIAAGICGFFTGIMAGGAALSFISSGVKTILMCWADAPSRLQGPHPDIHEEFVKRVRNKGEW